MGLIFKISPMFVESAKNYAYLKEKFDQFKKIKIENVNQAFGKSDKSFSSEGIYGTAIPKLRHAHLNRDVSIVYLVKSVGGQPVMYLYGFYPHKELGTGEPLNKQKQKSMAKKFQSQEFDQELIERTQRGLSAP
jgi:hypothetical protein